MYFTIDGQLLQYPPITIDVVPPTAQEYGLAGGGFVGIEPRDGVSVVAHFGENAVAQASMIELLKRRAHIGVHTVTFEDVKCEKLITLNVYMPRIERPGLYPDREALTFAETAITFRQIQPSMSIGHCVLRTTENPITVGDSKDEYKTPAAGRIFAVDGFIDILGTGASGTRIQISNGLVDYLTTLGDFLVASGTRRLENQVLRTDNTGFKKAEWLSLDVDGLPGNANSVGAQVFVWFYMFKP